MNPMPSSLRCALALWVVAVLGVAVAAGAPAEDEVRQLRRDLREAQAQIEKLKRENADLKRQLQVQRKEPAPANSSLPLPAPRASAAPVTAAAPAPAPAPLPAWDPDEVIRLDDLIQHFRSDSVAAHARYGSQRLRLQSAVERIEPP